MSFVDITYGYNTSDKKLEDIALINYLPIISNNAKVISGFIKGTPSNEWLLLAEKEFSNLINGLKNG